MAKQHGVDLHGWHAEWRTTADDQREVTLTKHGHKPITTRGRKTTSEEIILQNAVHEALMTEVDKSPADNKQLWLERLQAHGMDIRVGRASRAVEAAIRSGQEARG